MSHLSASLAVAFLLTSATAIAENSCVASSIQLLAEGKREQLAARFKSQPAISAQLDELALKTGSISEIALVNSPRFKEHKRISIGKPETSYVGAWANARSEHLGDVQFHIAMASKDKCELIALHLDFTK